MNSWLAMVFQSIDHEKLEFLHTQLFISLGERGEFTLIPIFDFHWLLQIWYQFLRLRYKWGETSCIP